MFLFKKIYNIVCDDESEKSFKLEDKEVDEYDLNKCIISNITDLDSRYLLLEIRSSLSTLIYQNIKIQNPDKDIVLIDGSPFEDDNNNEYKFLKLREIQLNANKDKLVIMQNLNQIQPFLYDLYNMNYIIKDEEKFVRICFDSFSESLTPVKDSFRIIILADRTFINDIDFAFLNRLEKMKITFEKLLDDNQKALAKKIIEEIDFKKHIENHSINYMLKDLLINCGKEEIQGLIYYETKKNNNKLEEDRIKETIYNKIVKISSQDIISILPEGNKIKDLYLEKKKYYNLKSYIKDLNEQNNKISIIYTFDSIAGAVDGIRKDMKFFISNIKMENKMDSIIREEDMMTVYDILTPLCEMLKERVNDCRDTKCIRDLLTRIDAYDELIARVCKDSVNPVVPVPDDSAQIAAAENTLTSFFRSAESNASVWRDKDGNFNTARLASDLTAGVVLGTVGGVVSGVVIKKKQVEKGFDALHCTVGGQTVADWGDIFNVGLRR